MPVAFEKSLRQPPPRHIDVYSQMVILLSGFTQQMGWLFVAMGMLFAMIFLPFSEWKYTLTRGPWEMVEGEVTDSRKTNTSINDKTLWEYTFRYTFNGMDHDGESYDFFRELEPGQKVAVEVNVRKPWVAKIEGMNYSTMPRFLIFILIFPLVGLLMVIPGIRRQAKSLDLLRNGEFTRGKISGKVHTGTTITINNRVYPQYKYTFDFEYNGVACKATCVAHITEPLEDETLETILFNPIHPDFNVVYDGISNSPQMDAMGNYIPVSWTKAWVFLAPAVSIFFTAISARLFYSI